MGLYNRSRSVSAIQKNPGSYAFTIALMGFIAGLRAGEVRHGSSYWDRWSFIPFALFAVLVAFLVTQTMNDLRDRLTAKRPPL